MELTFLFQISDLLNICMFKTEGVSVFYFRQCYPPDGCCVVPESS